MITKETTKNFRSDSPNLGSYWVMVMVLIGEILALLALILVRVSVRDFATKRGGEETDAKEISDFKRGTLLEDFP